MLLANNYSDPFEFVKVVQKILLVPFEVVIVTSSAKWIRHAVKLE